VKGLAGARIRRASEKRKCAARGGRHDRRQ
jgi:hypothetical protein